MTDGVPRPDGRPTRRSTLLAIAIALGLAAAFVDAAGVLATAVVGAAGAACLVVVLWTSRWKRGRTAGALLASLLALPVGLGLLAATAGTYLVLAAAAFPVDDGESVRSVAFGVVATVVLVTASVAVVFGALSSARPLLDRRPTRRAAGVALRTAAVPLVPGAVAGLAAGLAYLESREAGPGPAEAIEHLQGVADALLLNPSVAQPRPATFALLAGGAAVAAGRAVGALPLSELATNRADGTDWPTAFARVERGLTIGGVAVLATVPPLVLVELLAPGALPGPIAALVASGAIRHLALAVALLSVAVLGGVRLLRWSVDASVDTAGAVLAPFVGGLVVLALVVVTAEPILAETVAWVVAKLPAPFDEVARTVAGNVVEVYGPVTIVLLGTGAILLAVAGVLAVLWLLALGGVLDGRTGGGHVAGVGLFLAAATGAVVGLGRPLVLAGIAGGLVVADLDAYATTLAGEVGRHAGTGRSELLHAAGTVVVAGSGAGVALAVASLAVSPPAADPAVAMVGLLGGLCGALVLLAVLR